MTFCGEGACRRILVTVLLLSLTALPALAGFEDLEQEVQEIKLDNGLTILLLERHEVPVFSFWTYVNVGGVDEESGKTGIAHMFEHMAFKGTKELGTFDYKKERKVLEEMDDVYDLLQAERLKGSDGDPNVIARLEEEFAALQERADELVDTNAFGKLVEESGGVGMNAMTSWDATQYFYSFPSNKLELWALLESDRFINPVLREFYKERNVILEERNMRTESSPQGRLIEEWISMAYIGHPYGQPIIGHRSDIETYSRRDAEEFYEEHYGARNMVIAVVGDIFYDDLMEMSRKYFSRIPPGPGPVPIRTVEPVQLGERRVMIEEDSQPMMFIGYHIPSSKHPDAMAYEALVDILGQGRSSRLNSDLVKEDKSALFVQAFTDIPGDRYPKLLTIVTAPNKDVTMTEVETAVYDILDEVTPQPSDEEVVLEGTAETADAAGLSTDESVSPLTIKAPITQDELDGFKTRARAQFIRGLDSNIGIAGQLCFAEMVLGNWRELFRQMDKVDGVTLDDVQRVAAETFQQSNRTVGAIVTKSDSSE